MANAFCAFLEMAKNCPVGGLSQEKRPANELRELVFDRGLGDPSRGADESHLQCGTSTSAFEATLDASRITAAARVKEQSALASK
jgi:hypothetical protein